MRNVLGLAPAVRELAYDLAALPTEEFDTVTRLIRTPFRDITDEDRAVLKNLIGSDDLDLILKAWKAIT